MPKIIEIGQCFTELFKKIEKIKVARFYEPGVYPLCRPQPVDHYFLIP